MSFPIKGGAQANTSDHGFNAVDSEVDSQRLNIDDVVLGG